MIIDEKLLKSYGAQLITLEKDQYLLHSHTYPQNYYQIKSGSVKIASDKNNNNEFIHQFLGRGDPVAETFLLSETLYTINAIALSKVTVFVLSRDKFLDLLGKHAEVVMKLYQFNCQYVNYQRELLNLVAYSDPKSKIIAVIDYFKKLEKSLQPFQYEIPYTRKQLASLTGLRTETVIRTVKLLEKENSVKIVEGKIFY